MHGLVYLKESPYTDISSDYQTLSKEVYSKLDSSIRTKLQKKGITVMQNIYTGFDTEYKNIDLKYNKLLSIQMAVNTKILLKLPIVDEDYYFSSVETLTGKVNPINCASEKIKYENILDEINISIKEVRMLKYKSVCKDEESKNNTKYIKPITEIEIEKPQVFEESLELPKSTDSTESPESLESIESTESTEESIKENVKQSKKFTRTNMKSFT